jgi:hypothetical protein
VPRAAADSTTVGWVESPFQLLGAVEAQTSGALGRNLVVLPRQGVDPLARTVEELRRLGLPRGVTVANPSRVPRRVAGTLAIGDAFSGEVHRMLVHGLPDRLVLVDDGRSTRRAMEALVTPHIPLIRPHVTASRARTLLARLALARLRRLARSGRMRVVTALDLPPDVLEAARNLGIDVRRHEFEWLRSLQATQVPGSETVVLGTSLVANNLVKAQPYVEWVQAIARESPVTYWAHRREDARTLEPLGATPGIEITAGQIPVELSLRGVTSHRLITLPTTAATTLRLLVPGVDIHEYPVPESWWQPGVPAAARMHLVPDPDHQPSFDVPPLSLPLSAH